MMMPTVFAKMLQAKHNNDRYQELLNHTRLLSSQVKTLSAEIQASTDITTNTDSTANQHYVGTPSKYNSYEKQVAQLGKMYENTANWGCMMTKNIIDVRTAFSVGEGIDVKKREGFEGSAEKELAWVENFMQFNNLDEEMPQEYAKEAEIEGKVLLRFLVDKTNKNIRVIHVPWRKFMYTIYTPDYDFFNYTRAEYTGSGEPNIKFDLASAWFVYKRFGGSAHEINKTPPKTAFVLREIEDLDKAIWDWRKINRLFSMPTPVISCPDESSAKKVNEWIASSNWRIGKLLVLGGINVKFELVGWKGDGYTTVKEETQTLVKTISGTTGIPVHFLGYPELLSNRDTADNLSELIALSTSKERRTWIGVYDELFQKAMVIYNEAFGTTLNPMAIDATIKETNFNAEAEQNAPVPNRDNTGDKQE